MNLSIKKIIIPALILSLVAPSYADDTEIYLNSTSSSAVRPNIMFIMDTSGSMDYDAPVSMPDYNASITYHGRFNSSRYYTGSGNSFNEVNIACDELTSNIEASGFVTGEAVIGIYRRVTFLFLSWWEFVRYECEDGRTISNENAERRTSISLWDGNYLNYQQSPPDSPTQSRITVARQAFKAVVNGLQDVNVGLMHFGPFITASDDPDGGTIDVPILPIEEVRTVLGNTVDAYEPYGGTPLAESLYEAMLYFSGAEVNYGFESDSRVFSNSSQTRYRSPITDQCQSNHVVLFTDGVATVDDKTDNAIRNLLSSISATKPDDLSTNCQHNYNRNSEQLLGTCLEELAFSINNKDLSDLPGNQNLTLYTIGGFNLEQTDFLERTAVLGGGQYKAASSAQEIVSSLTTIINDILSVSSTFTAPAVSVNAFNASEHRDELFYAIFQPEKRGVWPGNLKKYKLTSSGSVVGQNESVSAINESTGFFNIGARDFWNATAEPDGDKVKLGGFANLLDAESRRVFSENTSGSIQPLNSVATRALYELEDELPEEEFNKIVNWTLGFDVNNEDGNDATNTRFAVGDPLHSEPLVITYGGTSENPDSTLFFGTNEGFIHAINTNTGEEHFAYLPSELMKYQPTFYTNSVNAANRPYGMDGPITTWINDKNHNNVLYGTNGVLDADEHAYIYAGMRRGGNKYYALDVTNRSTPSLKFIIRGGQGQFTKLGQTWSKAIVTKAKLPGQSEEKVVLIFSGGYDENQDNNETRSADSVGNAIYMVDAETGQRLWWASNEDANLTISSMTNSMPASPTPVDINDDGLVDYLFAADTGGRIFRVDFDHTAENLGAFATGGRIADLSENNEANNRRFYNQPSVSLVQDKQLGDHLSIAVGSGHRAKPVSNTAVADRMYIIKDRSPYQAPADYLTITEADENENGSGLQPSDPVDRLKVYNATALMNGGTAALTSQLKRLITEGGGFYVTFANTGEKVLSRALTFSGAVMFTTFSPNGENTSTCGPDVGQSRLYVIDQKWGIPVLDLDNDGEVNVGDASTSLAHAGIAPRPVVIYRSGGKKSIAIGTETFDDHRFDPTSSVVNKLRSDDQPDSECNYSNCNVKPIYWRQNEKDFSYASSSGESE